MKGNPKVLEALNKNLAAELAAVNQYTAHMQIVANWGYTKLAEYFKARMLEEKQHSEQIIERILFLDGTPNVTSLDPINVGPEIPKMLLNDHASELGAIKSYNEAVALCMAEKDEGTRAFFSEILVDEERHIDEIEEHQDQINQMTLPLFLTTQV